MLLLIPIHACSQWRYLGGPNGTHIAAHQQMSIDRLFYVHRMGKNDAMAHATGWVDFGSFHRLSEEARHSGSQLHISPLHMSLQAGRRIRRWQSRRDRNERTRSLSFCPAKTGDGGCVSQELILQHLDLELPASRALRAKCLLAPTLGYHLNNPNRLMESPV